MDHADLTERIIGAAYNVHKELGYGFLESVYEKALLKELRDLKIAAVRQASIEVNYKGEVVGEFIADLVVDGFILVELKTSKAINAAHEKQVVNYLVATGKPVGLILNFGEKRVEVKRKVPFLKESTTQ